MPNKITWNEPDRPVIPNDWAVIITGAEGTAYENIEDYLLDLSALLEEQEKNPNTEEST